MMGINESTKSLLRWVLFFGTLLNFDRIFKGIFFGALVYV